MAFRFQHLGLQVQGDPEKAKQIIQEALIRTDNDTTKAAERLGVSRRALYRWMQQLDLGTPLRHRETSKSWRSYVYFIQQDEDGPIKIGTSKGVKLRLSQLQNANPSHRLRLLAAVPGGPNEETTLHKRFAHARIIGVVGEWFRPTPDLCVFITEIGAHPLDVAANPTETNADDWLMFRAWCRVQGLRPLPATYDAIARYIHYLDTEDRLVLRRVLMSIAHAHREGDFDWRFSTDPVMYPESRGGVDTTGAPE